MAATDTKQTVAIKDLATTLKTDPRTLRAFLREHKLGCGRGTRYAWPSMNDPAVKRITREWEKAQTASSEPAKAA